VYFKSDALRGKKKRGEKREERPWAPFPLVRRGGGTLCLHSIDQRLISGHYTSTPGEKKRSGKKLSWTYKGEGRKFGVPLRMEGSVNEFAVLANKRGAHSRGKKLRGRKKDWQSGLTRRRVGRDQRLTSQRLFTKLFSSSLGAGGKARSGIRDSAQGKKSGGGGTSRGSTLVLHSLRSQGSSC